MSGRFLREFQPMNALRLLFILCPRWIIAVLLASVPLRADDAVLSADFSVQGAS